MSIHCFFICQVPRLETESKDELIFDKRKVENNAIDYRLPIPTLTSAVPRLGKPSDCTICTAFSRFAICHCSVYDNEARVKLHIVFFNSKVKKKALSANFKVFNLTRLGIEPEFTATAASVPHLDQMLRQLVVLYFIASKL